MILALMLYWLAPTTNCDGTQLTDLHHYEITYGSGLCDGSGDPAVCLPVTVTTLDVPASYWAYRLPFVGEPSVGEAWWWDVQACDNQGNCSNDCIGG